MALDKVGNYMKNIAKSMIYASEDVVKSVAPSVIDYKDSNAEVVKNVAYAVKDFSGTFNRAVDYIRGTKVYETANFAISNTLDDLASGNFYNKERELSAGAESVGLDMNFDFDESSLDSALSDIDGNTDDDELSAGDKATVDAIENTTKASTSTISKSIIASAKYSANASRVSTSILFAQNERLFGKVNSGLESINENLINLSKFNTGSLQVHIENSTKFYDVMTKNVQEQTAIFKEMLEMQRNQYNQTRAWQKEQEAKKGKKKRATYDDLVSASGAFSITDYLEVVGENTKNFLGEKGANMLFGGEGGQDMTKAMLASPLSFIPVAIVNAIMGPQLKAQLKRFDKTLSGVFGTAIARINQMGRDDSGGIGEIISRIFGVKDSLKTTIDTSKYNKGPIPFDGETKNAIVNVIPRLLAKQLSYQTGQPEMIYDYKNGKWTTGQAIRQNYQNEYRGAINSAFSDVQDSMGKVFSNKNAPLKFKNAKEEEDFVRSMQGFMKSVFNKGGYFNPNNPRDFYEYGFKSEQEFKNFLKVYKHIPKEIQMQLAGNVMSARKRFSDSRKSKEENGFDVEWLLNDNSGIDQYMKIDKDNKYISKNYNLMPKDSYGYTTYDYLRELLNESMHHTRQFDAIYVDGLKVSSPVGTNGKGNIYTSRGIGASAGGRKPVARGTGVVHKHGYNLGELETKRNRQAQEKSEAEYNKAVKEKKNFIGIESATDEGVESKFGVAAMYGTEEYLKDLVENEKNDDTLAKNIRSKLFEEPYKKAKDNLNKKMDSESLGKKFISRFNSADTLIGKWNVVLATLGEQASRPTKYISRMLENANESIYNFFFEREGETAGKKVKGFFGMMSAKLNQTFDRLGNFFNDKILNPLKEKLGLSTEDIPGFSYVKNTFNKYKDASIKRTKEMVKTAFSEAGKTVEGALDSLGLSAVKNRDLSNAKPGMFSQYAYIKYSKSANQNKKDGAEEAPTLLAGENSNGDKWYEQNGILYFVQDQDLSAAREGNINTWNSIEASNKAGRLGNLAGSNSNGAKWYLYKGILFYVGKTATEKKLEKIRNTLNNAAKNTKPGSAVDDINTIIKTKQEVEKEKDKQNVQSHARGARYVSKSGLTAISEGEMIIPSEMNPFNPKRGKVSKADELENERNMINEFVGMINPNLKAHIQMNAEGTQAVQFKNSKDVANFVNNVGTRAGEGIKTLFLNNTNTNIQNVAKDLYKNADAVIPESVAGGVIGGALGLITGLGPLAGMALGAGAGLVSKSDALKDWLFGEETPDGKGRKGGVIPRGLTDQLTKMIPDLKTFGIIGGVAGLLGFTPFGVLGGLGLGGLAAYLKHNKSFMNTMFGDDSGILNAERRKWLKDKFPNMAIGTAATFALGPFGLLGSALVGSTAGLITSTSVFKRYILGDETFDGKRTGGLVGYLKENFANPLIDFGKFLTADMTKFLREDIMEPLSKGIQPLIRITGLTLQSMAVSAGRWIKDTFDRSGIQISKYLAQVTPVSWLLNKAKTPAGAIKSLAGKIVSAPAKGIGALGTKAQARMIRKGQAYNMTASERIGWRAANGMDTSDDMYKFDEALAGMSENDLNLANNALIALGGQREVNRYHQSIINDLNHNLSYVMGDNPFLANQVTKLIQSGDPKAIKSAYETINKEGKFPNTKFKKDFMTYLKNTVTHLTESKAATANFTANKQAAMDALKKVGINVTDKNVGNLRKNVLTEINSKNRLDKSKIDEKDPIKQLISTTDEGTQEIVGVLNKIYDAMTKGVQLSAEQKNVVNKVDKVGKKFENKANEEKTQLSNARIEKIRPFFFTSFATINDEDRMKLFSSYDTTYYNKVCKIIDNNIKGLSLKEALNMSGENVDRLVRLASVGVIVKDPNKISDLSDKDIDMMIDVASSGGKINSISEISKLTEDQKRGMHLASKLGIKYNKNISSGNYDLAVNKIAEEFKSREEYLKEHPEERYKKYNDENYQNSIKTNKADEVGETTEFMTDSSGKKVNRKYKLKFTDNGVIKFKETSDNKWEIDTSDSTTKSTIAKREKEEVNKLKKLFSDNIFGDSDDEKAKNEKNKKEDEKKGGILSKIGGLFGKVGSLVAPILSLVGGGLLKFLFGAGKFAAAGYIGSLIAPHMYDIGKGLASMIESAFKAIVNLAVTAIEKAPELLKGIVDGFRNMLFGDPNDPNSDGGMFGRIWKSIVNEGNFLTSDTGALIGMGAYGAYKAYKGYKWLKDKYSGVKSAITGKVDTSLLSDEARAQVESIQSVEETNDKGFSKVVKAINRLSRMLGDSSSSSDGTDITDVLDTDSGDDNKKDNNKDANKDGKDTNKDDKNTGDKKDTGNKSGNKKGSRFARFKDGAKNKLGNIKSRFSTSLANTRDKSRSILSTVKNSNVSNKLLGEQGVLQDIASKVSDGVKSLTKTLAPKLAMVTSKGASIFKAMGAKVVEKIAGGALVAALKKSLISVFLGVATGGSGFVASIAVSAAIGFTTGSTVNAKEILGLKEDDDISAVQRCVAGCAAALSEVTFGVLSPEDIYGFCKEMFKNSGDSEVASVDPKNTQSGNNKDAATGLIYGALASNPMVTQYGKMYGGNKTNTSQITNPSSSLLSRVSSTFNSITDTAKGVKDYVVNGFTNNAKWLANKGSELADSAVNGAKSLWNSAGNAKDFVVDKAKGLFGFGKYGRGGYFKQDDPRYANLRFNAKGDTEYQDFRNSACGPIAAVNALYGGDKGVSPEEAARYALKGGYKERNGGTKPQFFTSYFQSHGRDAQYTSSSSNIIKNLKAGNPVVLQGKSNKIDTDTPYGVGPHYVTATGLDRNGNMIIQDSQDPRNNVRYNASRVLSKTQFGIASKPKKHGQSKYGRGRYYYFGKGPDTSNTSNNGVPQRIWDFLTSKGLGSVTVAAIIGNIGVESAGFQLDALSQDGHNSYGLCQWTAGRKEALFSMAQSMGKQPSDLDAQLEYLWYELTHDEKGALDATIACGNDLQKATETFCRQFERPDMQYAHLDRRISIAQSAFDTQGKGVATNGTYTGSGGSSGGSAQQSGGLLDQYLGKLAKPVTDMYNKIFGGSTPAAQTSQPGGGGGNFGGKSSNPNIQKATQYANSRIGTTGYGNNGCTTWVNDYLQHAGMPSIDLWVPNAMDNAKKGTPAPWKDASQGAVEGDVAVIETNHDPGDGPDHVVIADGEGGYWGNSSSKNQIVHGDMAGDWGAENIYGYIGTGGSGTGNVAQGSMTRSDAEAAGDATLDGQGKYGRGKVPPIIAKNQYGEGFLDTVVDYGTKYIDTRNKAKAYSSNEEWLEKIYKVLCIIADNTSTNKESSSTTTTTDTTKTETAKDRNANNANATTTGTAKARTETAKETKKNDTVNKLIEGLAMFKKAKGLGQIPNDLDLGGIISTMRSIASE